MKHICLDCYATFDVAAKKEVPDASGFDGILIDVCPVCISNHIEPAESKRILVLDATDYKHLANMANFYIDACKNNLLSTNDADLASHYRALIMQSEHFINNPKLISESIIDIVSYAKG